MLDRSLFLSQPDLIAKKCKDRGMVVDVQAIARMCEKERALLREIESKRAERNAQTEVIAALKAKKEEASELIAKVRELGGGIAALEAEHKTLNESLETTLLGLPNLPLDSVPIGADAASNLEVKHSGAPRPFAFTPKDHVAVGKRLGLDFESAQKMSGARFTLMGPPLAKLHRALAHFMLSENEKAGFLEHHLPVLLRPQALFNTAQLPKFESELFAVGPEENRYYLTPTAEVMLSNLASDKIFQASELPLRLTAQTSCFRSEAGSYGKDLHGMIRNHQFEKVELVMIATQEQGEAALEEMTAQAESLLEKLGLPYRRMLLCTGDMGFQSAKTYDLEVHLPSQGYREISSCSLCTDFQSRRMKARYRAGNSGPTQWAYTLNGSALAVGRTLVAVLENYQEEDGSLSVPEVLIPFMGTKRLDPVR